MKDPIAIIPAAGDAKGIWFPNDQERTDAMVPISGKPAIYWTLTSLTVLGIKKVCIVVKKHGSPLEEFVRTLFDKRLELTFIDFPKSKGVGHSVFVAASHLPKQSPTLVILGDTVLWDPTHLPLKGKSFATISKVDDPKRWCIAESENNVITRLINKPDSRMPSSEALTGIYFFEKGIALSESNSPNLGGDQSPVEMSDLLQPLIDAKELHSVEDPHWLDVGNPDHVYDAHSTLIQSRSFNTLKINNNRGTITKKSSYTSKFYDEINYFKILPSDLTVFFPRVITSSTSPDNLWIESEFYAYPTLADLYLFQNLTTQIWKKIFSQLYFICNQFAKFDYGEHKESGNEIYLNKNRQRFIQFWEQAPQSLRTLLSKKHLKINGRYSPSIEGAYERSESLLKSIAQTTRSTPIHGDLCFANILCEPNRGLMKLIDPRGSFGDKGVLGDPRYDIAKINHSVIGLYDFITNDLYHLKVNESEVQLTFPKQSSCYRISEIYRGVFFENKDTKEIDLITAWLFISMLPLHNDCERRQLALAIRGLELLNSALS